MFNVQLDESGDPLLCLHLTQRSADVALGVPYNIAGYAFLLELFSHFTGIRAGIFGHTLVDAHVYTSKADGSMAEYDHVPGLRQQLQRAPRALPRLSIDPAIRALDDLRPLLDADTETLMKSFRLDRLRAAPPDPVQGRGLSVGEACDAGDDLRAVAGGGHRRRQRDPLAPPGRLPPVQARDHGDDGIMGRKTFESMGKPLPGRRNVVVTRTPIDAPGVERVRSIEEALALAGAGDVWLVGGARIYEEGMQYADVIDVTYVPDRVDAVDAVRAPAIDERLFEPGPLLPHEDEEGLTRRVYTRRNETSSRDLPASRGLRQRRDLDLDLDPDPDPDTDLDPDPDPDPDPDRRPRPRPPTPTPTPDTVIAQHILCIYKGAKRAPKAITRSKTDAKARAQEALAKVRGRRPVRRRRQGVLGRRRVGRPHGKRGQIPPRRHGSCVQYRRLRAQARRSQRRGGEPVRFSRDQTNPVAELIRLRVPEPLVVGNIPDRRSKVGVSNALPRQLHVVYVGRGV